MSARGVDKPPSRRSPNANPREASENGRARAESRASLLRVVAYHEAGHAVAYLWYGQMVEQVTILPNQSVTAYCSDPLGGGTRIVTEDGQRRVAGLTMSAYKVHIIALYAGRAAQSLLCGEVEARRAFRGIAGDEADRRLAGETISTCWPGFLERRRRERRYRRLALWFVWRYRARIERVAEALLRFGCLSGVEAKLAADDGADAVAEHRRIWAGHDGGLWAEWSAALEQVRAAYEEFRPEPPLRQRSIAVGVAAAVGIAGAVVVIRYHLPMPGLLFLLPRLLAEKHGRPSAGTK